VLRLLIFTAAGCCLLLAALRAADLESLLTIRVQAIRVADDDGRRPANVTPAQVTEWVDFANQAFAAARIRFEFSPDDGDYSVLNSTVINDMAGTQDANWSQAKKLGDEVAAGFPGKLVAFFRHGPGDQPTGGAFSWYDYNFVVMMGFADASHCGHPHLDAFAHEVGHYLSLPHTFAVEPFATIEQAEAYFKEKGSDPAVFDGDGFSDTPPDPAIRPLECQRTASIVLDGVTFVLPRRNLMSYYDERDSLSQQQIAQARWLLALRLKGKGALPTNTGARSPLEAEGLGVEQPRDSDLSVQQMASFGVDKWSADAQLFCATRLGSSFTLTIPVERAGRFRLDLYATLAPDFGIVQAALDDKRVGGRFDAYAPVVLPSGPIPLATVNLAAGSHRLRFDVIGKNAASTDFKLGLDCLDLVPAPPGE